MEEVMKFITIFFVLLGLSAQVQSHELEKVMKKMQKNMRAISTDLRASKLSLKTLSQSVSLQKHALTAQKMSPHFDPNLTDEEKAELLALYVSIMDELLVNLRNLSIAINDKNEDLTRQELRNTSATIRKGHEIFRNDDEE